MAPSFISDPSTLLAGARILFYVCSFLILYVYVFYPLALAVISLVVSHERHVAPHKPFLSVLICAYNEEAGIAEKLTQTLSLDYPKDRFEILVVSDGSTDTTDEIVRSFADRGVRLLRTSRRLGKTNAQNEGVELCGGDIIVFSDATTFYHPPALRMLAAPYSDPEVGAVSGRYQYIDPAGSSPTGAGSSAFWNYENAIKYLQSRISTLTGCCGCIYSVRRDLYTSLPSDVISDLVQPLHVIKQGFSVVFEHRALAYEVPTDTSQQELTMRVRVITRGMRGILSARDLLNPLKHGWIAFQLFSHKILRWFVPLYLIGILFSSALLFRQRGFAAIFVVQLAFYLFALLSVGVPLHRRWKPFGIPLYFCTLNLAALISIAELARGRNYIVWETVRS